MNDRDIDERLEAHLRRTLQAVADTTPRSIEPFAQRRRAHRDRRLMGVAAALVLGVGVVGLVMVSRPGGGGAPAAPIEAPPVESTPMTSAASVLATAVPATVQPQLTVASPGWRMARGPNFLQPGEPSNPVPTPAPGCPGCGATRLVLTDDGGPLGGVLFTAWVLGDTYDVSQLSEPAMVGGIAGRFNSRGGAVDASQNRVTLAWPLPANNTPASSASTTPAPSTTPGSFAEPAVPASTTPTRSSAPGAAAAPAVPAQPGGGRTAFVDAVGMSTDEVVDLAGRLRFDGSVPSLPTPPAGLRQVEPTSAAADVVGIAFTNDEQQIEVYGTNGGVAGLVDWAAATFEPLMVNPARVVTVAGATVVLDDGAWWPEGRFGAYWVSGDWGYRAVGEGFASEADFLAVVADIELTDHPTTAMEDIPIMVPGSRDFSYATGWIVPEEGA